MTYTAEQKALSCFLPKDTLKYFDVVSTEMDEKHLQITLEEKDNPPLTSKHKDLLVESLGFRTISITDFLARGRKTVLTFRRRRWRVGKEILKRDIRLCAPGTRLEEEFGLFLKMDS